MSNLNLPNHIFVIMGKDGSNTSKHAFRFTPTQSLISQIKTKHSLNTFLSNFNRKFTRFATMSFLIPNRGAVGGTRIPLSIIVLVLCGFMFFVLLYTERISLMSSSSSNFLRSKSCPRKNISSKPSKKGYPNLKTLFALF